MPGDFQILRVGARSNLGEARSKNYSPTILIVKFIQRSISINRGTCPVPREPMLTVNYCSLFQYSYKSNSTQKESKCVDLFLYENNGSTEKHNKN